MKLSIPTVYTIKTRSTRSTSDKTDERWARRDVTYEIPDFAAEDVHFVAEWRQGYGGRLPLNEAPIVPAGPWTEHFAGDDNLCRLVKIDGRFYAPIRYVVNVGGRYASRVITADDAVAGMTASNQNFSFGDNEFDAFFSLSHSLGHWPGNAVAPDLKGKVIVEDGFDAKRTRLERMCADLVFVDGVMFCEVGEPVLVVQVIRDGQHERAALLIDTPKEYAWPSREMYFPLTELEAAERHMQDYWPDSCRTRVGSMKVLVPEALDTDIERQEAERSIRYFIEHSGKVLRHVSKEASGFWYDARDFLKGKETSLPERDVDHLLGQVKEFLQRVDPAGNDFDDEERFILRFGRIFIERWEFRPLVVDNSLKN